jgi:hypothetical protein
VHCVHIGASYSAVAQRLSSPEGEGWRSQP